jgi:hypothetical protein
VSMVAYTLEIFLLLNKLLSWSERCFCCFCHPAHGQQLSHKWFSQLCKGGKRKKKTMHEIKIHYQQCMANNYVNHSLGYMQYAQLELPRND